MLRLRGIDLGVDGMTVTHARMDGLAGLNPLDLGGFLPARDTLNVVLAAALGRQPAMNTNCHDFHLQRA